MKKTLIKAMKKTVLALALLLLAIVLSGCTQSSDLNSGVNVIPYGPSGTPGGGQIMDTQPLDYNLYSSGVLFAYVGQPYAFSFCDPQYVNGKDASPVTGPTDICNPNHQGQIPSGGNPPYHFQLESGKGLLPMGLTLHPNGFVDGTPTTPGNSYFAICAIDQSGQQDCSETWIEVKGTLFTFDSLTCEKIGDVSVVTKYKLVAKGTITGEETGNDIIWYTDSIWETSNSDNAIGYSNVNYEETDCGNWKLSSTGSCTREGAGKSTSWTFAYNAFLQPGPKTITSKVYAWYTDVHGGWKETPSITKQVQCG